MSVLTVILTNDVTHPTTTRDYYKYYSNKPEKQVSLAYKGCKEKKNNCSQFSLQILQFLLNFVFV